MVDQNAILVVDDDPDILSGLQRILRLDGYRVDLASTASQLFARDNWSDYFAILLDRKLPDGMAEDLVAEIKRRAPHTAVIVITGYAELNSALQTLREGAEDCLIKPLNPDALRRMLAKIVDRNTAKRRLREAEDRFRLLVENVKDYAMVMLDPDGAIVGWNAGAERITGYAEQEVLGQHFCCFYTSRDNAENLPAKETQNAIHNGQIERERYLLRKDGTLFYANYTLTPLWDEQHRLRGFAKIMRDLTERKREEHKLLQAERLAAIGEAMAGLVHESRNALNRTISAMRILQRRTHEQEDLQGILTDATEAQQEIQKLFEDVRHYASPLHVRARPCNIVQLIDHTWSNLATQNAHRRMQLVHHNGEVASEIEACPIGLGQVFRNLLENSIAACEDPLTIDVNYAVTELHDQDALRISLCDNGPGFSPEARRHAFEAFYTTKIHGVGLGLAICNKILEAHGGSIALGPLANEKHTESGAECIITLPFKHPIPAASGVLPLSYEVY